MQLSVNKYTKVCTQCAKGLPHNSVLPLLEDKVIVFKALVPVVVALRNEALKEHHWALIEEVPLPRPRPRPRPLTLTLTLTLTLITDPDPNPNPTRIPTATPTPTLIPTPTPTGHPPRD